MNRDIDILQHSGRPLTTDELAKALSLKSQSIRKRYSLTGSYFGIRPTKLPNRQLRWPADSLALLNEEVSK